MIGAKLTNNKGETLVEFLLPEDISEVKLSQYVDFMTAARKLLDEKEVPQNPVAIMADAVSSIGKVDIGKVLESRIGKLWEKTEGLDGTLNGMFSWITKVMTGYKPKLRTEKDFEFSHKGQTFQIPIIAQSPLYQKALLPDVTTGQAISAFELMRLSKRHVEKNGDPNGNRMYTDYLELVAIMALAPGESLPTDERQRTIFIEKRIAFFQDIGAETAIDIDFFLNSTLAASNQTHEIIGSLIQHLFALAVGTSRRNARRMIKRKRGAGKRLIGLDGRVFT